MRPEVYRLPCGIHVAMARAEKAWREALRVQTIADLVAHYQQDVDLTQQQRSEQWVAEHMRSASEKS